MRRGLQVRAGSEESPSQPQPDGGAPVPALRPGKQELSYRNSSLFWLTKTQIEIVSTDRDLEI